MIPTPLWFTRWGIAIGAFLIAGPLLSPIASILLAPLVIIGSVFPGLPISLFVVLIAIYIAGSAFRHYMPRGTLAALAMVGWTLGASAVLVDAWASGFCNPGLSYTGQHLKCSFPGAIFTVAGSFGQSSKPKGW